MSMLRNSVHGLRLGRRRWNGRGLWPSGRGFAFHVVSVPGEVTLEAVLNVGRDCKLVVFAGVDSELSDAAEALQGLIHLLSAEDGHVPINFSAHEQRRRGDAGDPIKGREFVPERPVFPREAKLEFVVLLVLVVAVQ